jgi:alpha-L-rhamnosidase
LTITILLVTSFAPASWALSIEQLTINARSNPLGIAAKDISFAWATTSDERDVTQGGYQIRVGTRADDADVWDSGEVKSAQQIDLTLPAHVQLRPATRYFWQVKIRDGNGLASKWSQPAWFETGLLSPADWSGAKWIAAPAATNASQPLPLLRGVVALKKNVKSARLYASAHGLYQLSLNGQRVGDQYLAPGWTDYPQRIQSQTYDVTSLLQKGENVIGAALGDGWYRGKVGLNWRHVYGRTLALLAKLQVTYTDGTTETFVTDTSWRSAAGPFVQADLQDGETYDARREQLGWDRPNFNAAAWSPVTVASDDLSKLIPQPDDPVRATELLPARTRTEPTPGKFVYDLGQNMVGVARIRITGRKGQTVRLRHAEELYRLGEQRGQLYTENLRTAKAIDTYTFASDATVTYQPTFTQHGFRYVEITGPDTPPATNDVHGVVLGSDLPNIGDLRLSHPMLDQLVRNIRWGQRGNFVSIPTDTPARDERLGWTGDINVFAPTASRYQDTRAFLSKWMDDLRDAQRPDGNIPAIVPQPRREFDQTGVGWSDAFITVPYAVWRATGDPRIVRRNWDAMQRFYRFVRASATQDGNLLEEGRSSWFSGDWLSLESGNYRLEEHKVIATAYFAENTRMMAEMAAALGETNQAAAWFALVPQIRAAFVAAYRQPDGSIYTGSQTAYALALGMDMITDATQREQTAAKFIEKLAADNYHLRTGFLGTPWLLPALSKIGRDDFALRLLLNEDYPSWGFEISMGATTVWERWNSIRANGEFGPVDMNSFNHYAYGAVGDWMFQHLGGLQILEPGYKKSRIAPLIGAGGLQEAQCNIRTPYGLLASEWRVAAGKLTLAVTVPANTTAEVVLPAANPESVREGSSSAAAARGVKAATFKDGTLVLLVGSGHYQFTTSHAAASAGVGRGLLRSSRP